MVFLAPQAQPISESPRIPLIVSLFASAKRLTYHLINHFLPNTPSRDHNTSAIVLLNPTTQRQAVLLFDYLAIAWRRLVLPQPSTTQQDGYRTGTV
jgi:hypothetical protein